MQTLTQVDSTKSIQTQILIIKHTQTSNTNCLTEALMLPLFKNIKKHIRLKYTGIVENTGIVEQSD